MKIGFVGTQCSGKSTQAKLLETKGYEIVPSASSLVAKAGVPVNREGTLSTQFMIAGMVEMQMVLHNTPTVNYVWERTHVDHLAYGRTANLWGMNKAYEYCVVKLVHNMMANYFDIVLYFPGYDLEHFQGEKDNGIRDANPEYRSLIDDHILAILNSIEVEYFTVPQGDLVEVNNFIMNSISSKLLQHE
jgi:hypothetical protein